MWKFRILILTKHMPLVLSVHKLTALHSITITHCTEAYCMSRTLTGRSDNDNFLHREIIYKTPQGSSIVSDTKVHKPPGDLVRSNKQLQYLTLEHEGVVGGKLNMGLASMLLRSWNWCSMLSESNRDNLCCGCMRPHAMQLIIALLGS